MIGNTWYTWVAMNNDNNGFRKMKENLTNNIPSYGNQHASAKQNVKETQTLPQLGNMKADMEFFTNV